jgi:hypothetical protein
MFEEEGSEPNDTAERTFLGVGGRLSSAYLVRDDFMPCEHLYSDNGSVEYSTSSRICCFFFITRQSPSSSHSVVCAFSVMFLSMVRFRHVIRFWSGHYNPLIFSEIPALRSVCVCVCCLRTKERTNSCLLAFPLSGNNDRVCSSIGLKKY